MCCTSNLWVDSDDPKRAGWIRTVCGKCGRFMGYRIKEGTKATWDWRKKENDETTLDFEGDADGEDREEI